MAIKTRSKVAKSKSPAQSSEVVDDVGVLRVPGVLAEPKKTASGIYRGRFACPDVQWTGSSPDVFGTFTITAEQLADAADTGLLWTDQDVQRGVKPEAGPDVTKELSLQGGYPDPSKYVFETEKADSIAEQLLRGDRTFLNSLIWNLRPGTFEAYWNVEERSFYIYTGRVYLPDSHHRHQAIVKAVHAWREAKKDYPKFSGTHQFKVELYFLSRQDEGNYFYAKNQLPKPTAKSKAFDLTTVDSLSLLAKLVIEKSDTLKGNVNRVTDRLSARNPQVVTLSTLREMMKSFAPDEEPDELELEGLAVVAAKFFDVLASIRPELKMLTVGDRKKVRARLLVDAAVMMHGYAGLMQDFQQDVSRIGIAKSASLWRTKLLKLSSTSLYKMGAWTGDFLAKDNPLWRVVGVVKPSRNGISMTVLNTGAARLECARVLRRLMLAPVSSGMDIKFLSVR